MQVRHILQGKGRDVVAIVNTATVCDEAKLLTEKKIGAMTVSRAVMELDLTESQTIVFRNAAHGGLSVVYRRPDGNIGWIDPARTKADGA